MPAECSAFLVHPRFLVIRSIIGYATWQHDYSAKARDLFRMLGIITQIHTHLRVLIMSQAIGKP